MAEGVEPSQAIDNGFHTVTAFAAGCGALKRPRQVCGLDYPFTVPQIDPGLRCCVSSLHLPVQCSIGDVRKHVPGFGSDGFLGFRITGSSHHLPHRTVNFPGHVLVRHARITSHLELSSHEHGSVPFGANHKIFSPAYAHFTTSKNAKRAEKSCTFLIGRRNRPQCFLFKRSNISLFSRFVAGRYGSRICRRHRPM